MHFATPFVKAHPKWAVENGVLVRTFTFGGFPEAIRFVVAVGEEAQRANHHPDLDIRYNRVRVALVTHDAGRCITQKDTALAQTIEAIAPEA